MEGFIKVSELVCKCGCNGHTVGKVNHNLRTLQRVLESIRDRLGKPVIINSGYRCEEHNKRVGGVSGSKHMKGQAADIRVHGLSPRELRIKIGQMVIDGYIPKINFIEYNTFLHIDLRLIYI